MRTVAVIVVGAVLFCYGFVQSESLRIERAFPGMSEYKAMLVKSEINRLENKNQKLARASN